jgi:hypothetical protein
VTLTSEDCPQEIEGIAEGDYEFIVDTNGMACGQDFRRRFVFERDTEELGSCRFDFQFYFDVYQERGPVDTGESRVGVMCGKEGRDSGGLVCSSGLSIDYEFMR